MKLLWNLLGESPGWFKLLILLPIGNTSVQLYFVFSSCLLHKEYVSIYKRSDKKIRLTLSINVRNDCLLSYKEKT